MNIMRCCAYLTMWEDMYKEYVSLLDYLYCKII